MAGHLGRNSSQAVETFETSEQQNQKETAVGGGDVRRFHHGSDVSAEVPAVPRDVALGARLYRPVLKAYDRCGW
jgi:hypothetical protein